MKYIQVHIYIYICISIYICIFIYIYLYMFTHVYYLKNILIQCITFIYNVCTMCRHLQLFMIALARAKNTTCVSFYFACSFFDVSC